MCGNIQNNLSAFLKPKHSFYYTPSLYGGTSEASLGWGILLFWVFTDISSKSFFYISSSNMPRCVREYRNRWQQPNAYSNIINEMCEHGVERSDTGFTFIFLQQHTCMKVRVKKVWSLDVWCAGIIQNNLSAFLKPKHSFYYTPSLYGGTSEASLGWGILLFWVFRYLFKIILLHFIQQHASMLREYRNRWQQPNAYSNIINEMCEHGVERSDTGFTFIFLATTYLHEGACQKGLIARCVMCGNIQNNLSAFLKPKHSFYYTPSLYGGTSEASLGWGILLFWVFTISLQNHSSTFHPATCLDVCGSIETDGNNLMHIQT